MNNLALSSLVRSHWAWRNSHTDLWAQFLKRAFKITEPNYCLAAMARTMPEGVFTHSNIASAPQKSAECTVGWIAHYVTGIMFAITFVAFVGSNWLIIRC